MTIQSAGRGPLGQFLYIVFLARHGSEHSLTRYAESSQVGTVLGELTDQLVQALPDAEGGALC